MCEECWQLVPAKIIRPVTDEERNWMHDIAKRYVELAKRHAAGTYPTRFTAEPS